MRVLRQDPTLCRRLGRSTNPQRQQFSKIKTSTSSWLRRKRDYNYNPTRPSDCIEPQASHPDHVDHGPRRPRPEQLRRAPTTSTATTSTTSRAAPPSSDHVDHVPSSSAELRPPRPQDYVPMMIAAKNGATTITTTVMTTGQKARGLDNFIANDTSSHLSNIATHRLHPPVVNKAKYYF